MCVARFDSRALVAMCCAASCFAWDASALSFRQLSFVRWLAGEFPQDRPDPAWTVTFELSSGVRFGTGVLVAPNWFITAQHYGSSSVGPGGKVVIDNQDVRTIAERIDGPTNGLPRDIALFRFEGDAVANPVLSDGLPGLFVHPLPGQVVTKSSYGKAATQWDSDGLPFNGSVQPRGLRYGRNVITGGNGTNLQLADVVQVTRDHDQSGDYVDFEYGLVLHDSGSPVWYKDGWNDWALIGGGYASGGGDIRAVSDWITDTIRASPNGDPNFSFASTSAPLPTADRDWVGTSTAPWGTASNWAGATLPIADDTIIIDYPNIAINAGTDAVASDLFIVEGPFPSGASIVQSGGSLTVTNDLILGPEASAPGTFKSTTYQLGDGNVSAERIYVGYAGRGNFMQWGGAVDAQYLEVGSFNDNSSYTMFGANATLSADGLVLGAKPGSKGALAIIGGSQVEADHFTVGGYGDGEVTLSGGSIDVTNRLVVGWEGGTGSTFTHTGGTVDADTVILGAKTGSTGAYVISDIASASRLTTQRLAVGNAVSSGPAASGNFTQNGGLVEAQVGLAVGANTSSGTYTLNGGTLDTPVTTIGGDKLFRLAEVLALSRFGLQNSSVSSFVLDGGTHNTEFLLVGEDSTYTYSSGTLNLNQGAVVRGTLELTSGAGTLNLSGLLDFTEGNIVLAPGTNLAVANQSLLIHDAGLNVVNVSGKKHLAGTTLVLNPGESLNVSGAINDPVEVLGSGADRIGGGLSGLSLTQGIMLDDGASVDLGAGTFQAWQGSASRVGVGSALTASEIKVRDFASIRGELISRGTLNAQSVNGTGGLFRLEGTLDAAGTINAEVFSSAGISSLTAPKITIADGEAASLTLNSDSVFLFGTEIHFEIGGTDNSDSQSLEYDQLTVNHSGGIGSFFLDLSLLGDYTPQVGDAYELVNFGSSTVFDLLGVSGLDFSGGLGDQFLVDTVTNGLGEIIGLELLTVIRGDSNGDGEVSQADLDNVLLNWGDTVTAGLSGSGDLTGDGFVNQGDLDLVLLNWGSTASSSSGGSAVPEPGGAALAFIGLTAMWRRRR
ncbi:MAG: hypothetical protein AAGE65_05905 [Planctomycetota bacterium]